MDISKTYNIEVAFFFISIYLLQPYDFTSSANAIIVNMKPGRMKKTPKSQ